MQSSFEAKAFAAQLVSAGLSYGCVVQCRCLQEDHSDADGTPPMQIQIASLAIFQQANVDLLRFALPTTKQIGKSLSL